MQLLEGRGWRVVKEDDDSAVPVFCWATRKAGDFPANASEDVPLPLIRPFPQDFTRRLDDKQELAMHLQVSGHEEIQPSTWCAEEFLLSDGLTGDDQELWFLKHSQGVKGNGVHVYAGLASIRGRLEELGTRG